MKDADSDELLCAIHAMVNGEALLDSGIASKMIEEFRRLGSELVGADGLIPPDRTRIGYPAFGCERPG